MKILSRRLPRILSPVVFLVTTSPLAAADDPTIDRLLASHCAQCHGTNGYAAGGFDSLAGKEVRDLYDAMIDMKEEDRPEDIMDHQALGYSDDQIWRIARFYASLPENVPTSLGFEEIEEGNDSEENEDSEQNEQDEDSGADD